jgi:hypothetical protein
MHILPQLEKIITFIISGFYILYPIINWTVCV